MSSSATTPTPEETANAKRIKEQALSEGLPLLSDFEYLQHAIVAKENVEKGVARIRNLLEFKEKHRIREAQEEDPMSVFVKWENDFPGFFNRMGIDSKGRPFMMITYRKFQPKKIQTEEDWCALMGCFYHMFNAMSYDLDAVRNGIVMISDSKNVSWANFSLRLEKRAAEFYQDSYPVRIKAIVLLDAPVIVNAMVSLMKVFLSKKVRDAIKLDSSDEFLASGELPKSAMPERLGGPPIGVTEYEFIEEHIKLRARNEAMIKMQ